MYVGVAGRPLVMKRSAGPIHKFVRIREARRVAQRGHQVHYRRRLNPAETIEHTSELRPLSIGPHANRMPCSQSGAWPRRGTAAKGPFAGPLFRNSDPETH